MSHPPSSLGQEGLTAAAEALLRLPVGSQLCEDLHGRLLRGRRTLTADELYVAMVLASLMLAPLEGSPQHPRSATQTQLHATANTLAPLLTLGPFSLESPTARQAWVSLAGQGLDLANVHPVANPRHVRGKPSGGLWTSSVFTTGMTGWQPLVQSGYLGPASAATTATTTTFDINTTDPRHQCVGDAEDWRALCDRFPRRDGDGVFGLDWEAAATQLDYISLIPLGILHAQYVPVTREGATSILMGWDAESTIWLNPAETLATVIE